jgi:hypothetical protein
MAAFEIITAAVAIASMPTKDSVLSLVWQFLRGAWSNSSKSNLYTYLKGYS